MPIIKTFEEFKNDYIGKFPSNDIILLEFSTEPNFKNYKNYVITINKFGKCISSKAELMKGRIPSIESALNKIEYLTNQIRERFPRILKKYKIIQYIDSNNILVETKYGLCKTRSSILLDGCMPTIQTAVNKTEYLINQIKERFPENLEKFKILEYINKNNVIVQNKYGLCKMNTNTLLKGYLPSMKTALNRNEYFISKAKEIHGDRYSYEKVNYINCEEKVFINCSIHGYFLTNPNNFLHCNGCPDCKLDNSSKIHSENPVGWTKTNWWKAAQRSKLFESFKVYILRCWNETEEFYKIGRTFTKIKCRFGGNRLPYNYEVIQTFEFKELTEENCRKCHELETELKNMNRENKYKPKIEFGGKHECLKKVVI